MPSRPPLVVGVVVIVVLLVALAGGQAVASQVNEGPEQPIAFSHITHANVMQLDCIFCHRNAEVGQTASVPAVEQCMFCHKVVEGATPSQQLEIDKVQEAFASGSPIDWTRVHRVPDHVRFVHEAHITAGIQCSACHGNVQDMATVRQVRPLKMGDCVACHRVNDAPTDCVTCHK